MSTAVVNSQEFGIEESKALQISQAFTPKLSEFEGYVKVYEYLLSQEITTEVVNKASELRKKLVKVRTGIADVHKTEKAFYLASGKYIDALKNKLTLPVTQMEEKLDEIENYFINLEKQRLSELQLERIGMLKPYEVENVENLALSSMDDSVFEAFLLGSKQKYEAKIQAIKAEEERVVKEKELSDLRDKRTAKVIRLVNYIDNYDAINFGVLSEEEYMAIVNKAIEKRTEDEKEQARIKEENERLAKEKEELEAKIKARSNKLQPYIAFIRDYNSLMALNESDFEKQFNDIKKGAELQWESERQEQIRKQAEEDKLAEERRAAQEQANKLKAELEAKEKAEQDRLAKIKAEEDARLKAEEEAKKAPIKQQLINWVESFTLPNTDIEHELCDILKARFDQYKVWAKSEINKL